MRYIDKDTALKLIVNWAVYNKDNDQVFCAIEQVRDMINAMPEEKKETRMRRVTSVDRNGLKRTQFECMNCGTVGIKHNARFCDRCGAEFVFGRKDNG